MNYLDLFHGIGGFALGAYWAGMKFDHHYCSDIEPWCQKLYAQRFPDSVQLGDITKINAADLPAGEWILSGGFPCQDISIAGKGAGIHGERSGLWFEYWRLIRDLRPRFAIIENVGALVNWFDVERRLPPRAPDVDGDRWAMENDQYQGIAVVARNLAEIGYNGEWQDIRASDVGANHKRERIWIVAYPKRDGCRNTLATEKRTTHHNEKSNGTDEQSGRNSKQPGPIASRESIPHSTLQLPHGSGEARGRRGEFADGGRWHTEPDVGMLVDGLSVKLDGG